VKTYQAGEIIGSLGPASEQRQEYTAMCKTDCLLVSIEQNVMGMLLQHKDRMLRESVCKFFLQNLPNFSRFYTPLKVLETINEITTRITLSKGDLVLRENSTYADPAYFYVIIEGQVRLSKVMSYLDE
jgi:CRP-like cAMP-binding protein